jgi:hypothetical protein
MENKKKETNTSLLITIGILIFVVIVGTGIGVFFWGKSLIKKNLSALENKITTENIASPEDQKTKAAAEEQASTSEDNTTNTQVTTKTRTLENLFQYPHSLSFESGYNFTEEYSKIMMKMETLENTDTIYDYYNDLGFINNWIFGSQGLASDNNGGWINIEEKDFRAEIQIENEGDKRIIRISVTYTSENMSFSQNKPQKTFQGNVNQPLNESPNYVIADSNTRIISESELFNLTPWQLKVARNEIYARHGRAFVHKDLQCYFGEQSWYQIDPSFNNSYLSSIENKNIATILSYETKINSPYLRYDSGCH